MGRSAGGKTSKVLSITFTGNLDSFA